MKLYTCGFKKFGGSLHPCAKAANALTDAGYEYEIETVPGYKNLFWTRRNDGENRAEIRRLSGQDDVPVVVLDSGEAIAGSSAIVDWAKSNPA